MYLTYVKYRLGQIPAEGRERRRNGVACGSMFPKHHIGQISGMDRFIRREGVMENEVQQARYSYYVILHQMSLLQSIIYSNANHLCAQYTRCPLC